MSTLDTSVTTDRLLLRLRVEEFLYEEAALLDAWRLQDWLELVDEGARYYVPPTDRPDARDSVETAFIISDRYELLVGRVNRLETDAAWVERPRSRTHRMISNVRITGVEPQIVARSNFIVHRVRRGVTDCFTGTYEHHLRPEGDSFRITERWAILQAEALQPLGKIGFIL